MLTGIGNLACRVAFGFNKLETVYSELRSACDAESLPGRLLRYLNVTCRIAPRDLSLIPRSGAVIVTANHPFGILEGAVLVSELLRVRPDVRVLANSRLSQVMEIRDLLIPIDVHGNRNNSASIRNALAFLGKGGVLVIFPAGEVAHFSWTDRRVSDPPWSESTSRLVDIASRHGANVTVLPICIKGANSRLFQAAGVLHPRLRTALLGRELLNKRNATVDVRIGTPIPKEKLIAIGDRAAQTRYLRWRTDVLAKREEFHPLTRKPLLRRTPSSGNIQPVAPPAAPGVLANEISALGADAVWTKAGSLAVYLQPAAAIPNVLQEIGRLREITFREAGEGTGKPLDLDRFDPHYLHLFVWDTKNRNVVGAYRLARTGCGADGLYTATLFHYGEAFLQRMGPALELGRSFIRKEYQGGFAPLLALWKGIGLYVSRNPECRTLFGPVSISNRYQAFSRSLIVGFLGKHMAPDALKQLVSRRNSFADCSPVEIPAPSLDTDDVSDIVSDLEPDGSGMPILLRQYLRLGGKLLAFNVDPEFSNALDGLILVDLSRTEPRLLARYLGKAEAARFLSFHMPGLEYKA
jgi:putative hemolysin